MDTKKQIAKLKRKLIRKFTDNKAIYAIEIKDLNNGIYWVFLYNKIGYPIADCPFTVELLQNAKSLKFLADNLFPIHVLEDLVDV